MKLAPASRWTLALVAAAVLAVLARFAYQALVDPAAPFLAREAPAEWITFAHVQSSCARPGVELPASFTRSFELPAAPRSARLRVRLFSKGSVAINGREVAFEPAGGANWKSAREAEVAALLVAGTNALQATAVSDCGPPALWLALEVDGATIASDASWRATCAGSAERPARLASTPMDEWSEPSEGSTIGAVRDERLNPRPLGALARLAPRLMLFAALSAALVYGLRALARRRGAGFDGRATWLLVGAAAVLFAALFVRNRALHFGTGFDAEAHADYVNYLLANGRVPLADEGWEMYQPPLYYAVVAAALKLGGYAALDADSVHVARAVGWLALVLQTLFVALALRILLADRPRAAFVGACVAVVLPMQLYLFQNVTNEGLAATFVSASVWLALRIVRDDSTRLVDHLLLGLALGAGMLTKFSALLAVVIALGVLAARLALRRERAPLVWLRTVGATAAATLLVCGWHYLRVHGRFGSFLVGNFDRASGFEWWQDPGYHTLGDYLRFGQSLQRPLLSGMHSCADALYSTLWGDGLIGGRGRIDGRPPWDYELLSAGMLLALLPSLALALGLVLALVRLVREPRAGWFLALGLQAGTLAALLSLTLRLPYYAQTKAVYASAVMIPLCAVIALGFDWLAERARALAPLVWTLLGTWALASFVGFWSPSGEALESLAPRDAEAWAWSAPGAGGDERGGLAALERSVARCPDNPNAQAVLAMARFDRGDAAGALVAGRAGLAADPWNAPSHYALGLALHAQGDVGRALEHLERAARIAPLVQQYALDLTTVLIDLGRWSEAQAALERSSAKLAAARLPVAPKLAERLAQCRARR